MIVNDCERNRKCCTANSMRRQGSSELWLMDALSDWLRKEKGTGIRMKLRRDGKRAGIGMGRGCLKTTGEWLAGGNRPALILLTILFSSPPFFACRAELFQFDASACGKLLLTAFAVEWHKLIRKSNEATTTMMVKVTRLRCTAPRPHFSTSWVGKACFQKFDNF